MAKAPKKSLANVFSRAFSSVVPKKEVFWYPASQIYPRLTELEPASEGLFEKGGIFAAWHLGVRPQWLKVGASQNLAGTFNALSEHNDIVAYDRNRGVFITWAFPSPDLWQSQVRFLVDRLEPGLQNLVFSAELNLAEDTTSEECPLPPGTSD